MDLIEKALDSHAKKYETHEKELAKEKEVLPAIQIGLNKQTKFVKKKHLAKTLKNIIIIVNDQNLSNRKDVP